MLGERVLPLQWVFYALAFAGVFVVQRFDANVSPLYLACGIFSAFCSGLAYNFVRSLRGREHPLTVVLHSQLIGVIVGAISLLFNWQTPVGFDWVWLLLIGITSQLGQMALTSALQKEAVAGVAIVNYSGLIYALIIGSVVFNEVYTITTVAGMLLVVIGVVSSIIYSKRRKDIEELEATAG